MKFQDGDKIIVLATGDKGEVVEWINKKMLTIRVDGVEFPVYADQIDFPYYNDFSKPKEIMPKKSLPGSVLPKREKQPEKIIEKDGVWLSFFPVLDKDVFDDDIISHFKIYLLNHSDDYLDCMFSVWIGHTKELEMKNNVRALEGIYLIDLALEKLSDHPKFCFEFSIKPNELSRSTNFVIEYKPKAKQIFKLANEVIKQEQASFKHLLFKDIPLNQDRSSLKSASINEEDVSDDDGFDFKKLLQAGFKVKRK